MLDNLSHVYKGLLSRNRAFASFKNDELEIIHSEIRKFIQPGDWIFDPMSGYGGGMSYFGARGYKTFNVEINPPAYYWQVLINPINRVIVLNSIEFLIINKEILPAFPDQFSFSDTLFTSQALTHINNLYNYIFTVVTDKVITISLLLPFVARFANYQRSSKNLTHFIEGGLCSFQSWRADFYEYLSSVKELLSESHFIEKEHVNKLESILDFNDNLKFDFFVTSPPYPNYRDYSKLFKIENWVLDNLLIESKTNFHQMIGSNNVSGKKFGEILSPNANSFLKQLLEKSTKLSKKQKSDIQVYYYPYFALYFYTLQEAYLKVANFLTSKAIGYIVVNDNITRDIQIPVGKVICDVFCYLGFETKNLDESQISHFGNIGKTAKRINSHHTRHIIIAWKK
jgi:hypothetical protein